MTQNKGKNIMVIDNEILDSLTARAQASPRLRMNLNFHQSLDEKCHRFLNAVEPGANIPIHRHPEKEESFVVLRGRIRVITYNDDGTIIDDMVLNPSEGRYGVNEGKNVWHTVEALEPGSVIFECKEGPFVEHEEEFTGIKARIIQHEYDHLEGHVHVDRIAPMRKFLLQGKLRDISEGKCDADYRMLFPKKKRR